MQIEDVVAPDVVTHLADRFEVREALDVTDRPSNLGDDDVRVFGGQAPDPRLDLFGDVRDDLDRRTEELAAAFARDDGRIDAPRRHAGVAGEVLVDEPLVMAEVEVGFGSVVGHEDLAVLERVHRAGIDVDVWIELLHRDPQAAGFQQPAEGRRREALAEAG